MEYFFHGTMDRSVYSLMLQGFSSSDQMFAVKGVYLCNLSQIASSWGKFILDCKLKKDALILWYTAFDSKAASCLNSDILMCLLWPEFWEDSPLDLQFKKHEIIAVYNYIIDNCYHGKRRFQGLQGGRLSLFQRKYSPFYKHLKWHGFSGVGFTDEAGSEVLIFEPMDVQPVSAHRWNYRKNNISPPMLLNELKTIQEKAELEWCREQE
jgi:hypothetical protein